MEPRNSESQEPLFMPGPQFEEGNPEQSWFRRHSQKIVITLIVALLVVGGYYFFKSYQQRKAVLGPALQELTQTSPSPTGLAEASPGATPTASPTVKGEAFPTITPPATPQEETGILGGPAKSTYAIPEVRKQDGQLVARAAKGNGATHLARHALKEYLQNKKELQDNLKAEHKIYIEDYLQKHTTHPKVLKIGDEISFSDGLINEAVEKAQKLTDKQIQNLSKYVPLVPSLQSP